MLWKKEKPRYQPYTTIYLQNSYAHGQKITTVEKIKTKLQQPKTNNNYNNFRDKSPYITEEGGSQNSERSLVRDKFDSIITALITLNSYNHRMLWKIIHQLKNKIRYSLHMIDLYYFTIVHSSQSLSIKM